MRANSKDEQPREFGVLPEADHPKDGWQPLGVHEGRKRPVMIDRDSQGHDDGRS